MGPDLEDSSDQAATVDRASTASRDGVAHRPRIVVIAYACAPGRGSEPGAGWGITQALLGCGSVTAIVADEFMPSIRDWQAAHPEAPLEVVGLPEGRVAIFLGGIHRIPRFLQYLLWLRKAGLVARKLHATGPFDVAVHASYGAYWLPTPAVDLGIPSVWGPVGGAVATPVRLWPSLGVVGALGEMLDLIAVRILSLLPSTRRTWRQATIPVVNNIETLSALPRPVRDRAHIINSAPFVEVEPRPRNAAGPYVIFPSALDPRKGPRLALEAFAHVRSDVRLIFAAGGPEGPALLRMVRALGLEDRVEFTGWIPRDEMWGLLAGASAAIYTGLREEGGLALVEGMLHGVPLVVLGHGGARTVAEAGTDPGRVRILRPGRPAVTALHISRAIDDLVNVPPTGTGPTYDQASHRRRYQALVMEAIGRERPAWPSRADDGHPASGPG